MEQAQQIKLGGGQIALNRRNGSGRITVFFADRISCGSRLAGRYGGAFAEAQGLNAALVQPLRPRWYQGRILDKLEARLAPILGDYDHVTFAGAGMGGYGALAMAERFAVDHVLAMRPVSTLDGAKCPAGKGRQSDMERLGGDLAPVLTHRALNYTVFAGPDGDAEQLHRFYLPPDRTIRHDLSQSDPNGTLRLPDAVLLDLLGTEAAPERRAATG